MKVRIYSPFFPSRPDEGAFLVALGQIEALLQDGHRVEVDFWKGPGPSPEAAREKFSGLSVRHLKVTDETPGFVAGGVRLLSSLISGKASGEQFYYPPRTENGEDDPVDWNIYYFSFAHSWLKYKKKQTEGRTAVYFHNLESDLYAQRARVNPLHPASLLFALNSRILFRHEGELGNLVDELWFLSPVDLTRYQELHPQVKAKCRFVQPVLPEKSLPIAAERPPGSQNQVIFGFVGGLQFLPNRESARWITQEIAPLLRDRGFTGEIWIVGKAIPRSLKRAAAEYPFIKFLGFVPDLAEFWSLLSFSLVPHIVGSGVRTKLLESLGIGVPVIANAKALAPISPELANHPLVFRSESASEWAELMLKESRPRSTRDRLASEGIDWKSMGKRIYGFLGDLSK